jgi:putative ABC transport system permease protein
MVIHSKLRSWLTILGIVIGVAAVIAIVSIGAGMESAINNSMGNLGSDILTITAGASRGGSMFGPGFGGRDSDRASGEAHTLTRTDTQTLRGMPEILLMDTEINGRVVASYRGSNGTVQLTGVDQKVWSGITTKVLAQGRMLDSADQNVIIIGGKLADDYFDSPLGLNKMLTIEGSAFRVVGILDDDSTSIYMPIAMAYQVIDDKETDVYDSIVIKVKDESQLDTTVTKIESKLRTMRHVTDKTQDFSVTSSKQMQATRAEMMSTMSSFLTAIAAVSLIVGAVGIANTMFTSVLEKTKEIGIMKAIGARNRDILLIFILNAALIGLVGGLIGILLGTMLSAILPYFLAGVSMGRGGLTTLVSLNSVLMALGVSVFVGITAGIVPAYQGSKLRPVDALRYQ